MPLATCTVRGTWFGQVYNNVLKFVFGATSPAAVQAGVDLIGAAYTDYWIPTANTNFTLNDILVRFFDGSPAWSAVYVPETWPVTGENATGEPLVSRSLVVSLQAQVSPPNRGRIYLGGLSESHFLNSVWTAAAVAAAQEFGDALIAIGDPLLSCATLDYVNNTAVSNGVDVSVARAYEGSQNNRRLHR